MLTSTRISRVFWAFAVATLLLDLYGCGSSHESEEAARSRKKADSAHKVIDPATRSPEDMVAAVSPGKGGPPVGLKFELRSNPEAGQPLDIDIAVLPDAPTINLLHARFQCGEGLDLIEGGELEAVEKPAQGSVIRHVLRLVPKRDGIFVINASVSLDLADDSIVRTFTIPVIVGDGLPELAARSEVAEGEGATGTGLKAR
jgi:hypothetical protein